MKEIRQLIREMLLTEKVYGAQAVVYHGSPTPPDVFIPVLLNDDFDPGLERGAGDMYGKGLYTVYDLGATQTESGEYGPYIYKFKINLFGFICFDPEVALLVYKRPLSPVEQAQELGLDAALIKKLKGIRIGTGFTSESALPASIFLKGKVKGLIFTGSRDGRVAVIYDQTVAVPVAWARAGDKNWMSIDKSLLKPALRKSAFGDWESGKYDFDPVAKLAKLSKLSPDKRMFKGSLDFYGKNITSLPAGLQVGGNINLYGTKITSLPDDLQVGGFLDIRGTIITSLPAGLSVGGDLDISNTNVTLLPVGLQVGGFLDIRNTNVTLLPADLKVGGTIYGFTGDKSQVPLHLRNKLK